MARRTSTKSAPAPEVASSASVPEGERITVTGRLCADPVLRQTKSGKAVTTIRLAVAAADAETTFWSVVIWNRTAEVACEYLRKGRTVEITGRKQQRSYEAADGTTRDFTEIVAFRVQFLGRPVASPSASTTQEVA